MRLVIKNVFIVFWCQSRFSFFTSYPVVFYPRKLLPFFFFPVFPGNNWPSFLL